MAEIKTRQARSAFAPPARYVHVLIERASEAVDRPFTYRVPPSLAGQVETGSYVLVPFGKEVVTGFVLESIPEPQDLPPEAIKDLHSLLAAEPLFDEHLLRLARWMAGYYQCLLIDALHCLLPEGLIRRVKRVVELLNPLAPQEIEALKQEAPVQGAIVNALMEMGGKATADELTKALEFDRQQIGRGVRALQEKGWVRSEYVLLEPSVRERRIAFARLVGQPATEEEWEALRHRAPKQVMLLQILEAHGGEMPVSRLLREGETSTSVLRALQEKGWVEVVEQEVYRTPPEAGVGEDRQPAELTPEQQQALALIQEELDSPHPQPVLIYGVTASGKTEVYLRAIAYALQRGKQAIVLVPEISLTAQTVDIFRQRFGERVAILHSALSPGERFDEWRRIQRGEVDIVVGARSAIFAPVQRLGLIVIDEEHETSYKQETTPRYHARDVALWRAQDAGACVVLGSATPSIESHYRAERGDYRLALMLHRIEERPLAEVEIVDMRQEEREGVQGPLSRLLLAALKDRLEKGEQAILFLNRRGFSTFILCRECGASMRCPNCDVSLVWHRTENRLRCHHCDAFLPVPKECPSCGGVRLGYIGYGTERVEEVVRQSLPLARVLRMDRDTTARKNAHAQILRLFRHHEADILVGTQMVAKGLDFPNVTLVGVISADIALNFPEFRAAERTFQLLTQVSGRAGRGEKRGLVIVQTYNPEHYSIRAAQQQNFEVFYRQEIRYRREVRYPPFASLANLLVAHESQEVVRTTIERVAEALREAFLTEKVWGHVLGPAPAPLAKLKGRYRWHVLVKTADSASLQRILNLALQRLEPEDRKQLIVDVDPVHML